MMYLREQLGGLTMKRYEQMQDAEKRLEIAQNICDAIMHAVGDCEKCPFAHRCYKGNNGVMDYFMEEVEK